jgi:transposase
MTLDPQQLNTATFIGIDAHPDSHTAIALNRFKETKGHLTFPNTLAGIKKFTAWLTKVEEQKEKTIIGIEGGGNARNALILTILKTYDLLFEVNPLYTKHKRSYGTRGDKTDLNDAKLIAGVLTTELEELPRITPEQLNSSMLCLKKTVWFYEEISTQGTRLKNQLHKLLRECNLTKDAKEKQVLRAIIKTRKQELSFTNKTKRKQEREFKDLFPGNGKNLKSVRGIGITTAARLVSHTNGIDRFRNRNSYVRYAGIAPLERSSGKGKKFVNTTRGNRKLNSVLYFAVLDRIVWDKAVKTKYQEKIASGKTKLEAIKFLMRKTAIMVYGMLKSGENYDPDYIQKKAKS